MDIKVRGYVSCVMGCPYEGEIDPKIVNFVAKRLLEMGCYEISLGDTIGIGNPGMYIMLIDLEKTYTMLNAIDIDKNLLAVHFHNTYDRAIQNLVVALSVLLLMVMFLGGNLSYRFKCRGYWWVSVCKWSIRKCGYWRCFIFVWAFGDRSWSGFWEIDIDRKVHYKFVE